jgi:hypothetical protein
LNRGRSACRFFIQRPSDWLEKGIAAAGCGAQ